MDSPDVQSGDTVGFERFSLEIQALVGLLKTLGTEGEVELQCGSHVARLLTKLPPELRSSFRRHKLSYEPGIVYTLLEFAKWLKFESWCQETESIGGDRVHRDRVRQRTDFRRDPKSKSQPITILHGADQPSSPVVPKSAKSTTRNNAFCPYCDCKDHYLSQCTSFQALSKDQVTEWIKINNRCWKCGCSHRAVQCTLKKPCRLCNRKHLQILHDVNDKPVKEGTCLVSSINTLLYMDRPVGSSQVLLKVIRVILQHKAKSLDTYAKLDDGSERTILLSSTAQRPGLTGQSEDLTLRTIRQDITNLHGTVVCS